MAGRKQRNSVDYFPHFVKQGRTKGILKAKFGHEGYSVWYQLLETLAATDNHFYDCSDEIVYEYLLAEIGTSDETFKSIVDFLVRVGKLDRELWENDRVIWCQKLVDNLAYVYDKRVSNAPQKPKLREKKSPKPPISGPEMNNTGSEMTRSKVKGIEEEVQTCANAPQNGAPAPRPPRKYSLEFDSLWESMLPAMKKGKKAAYRHYKAMAGTPEQKRELFNQALNNYKGCERVRKGFIMNGSRFFNELEDWVNHEEVPNGKARSVIDMTDEEWEKSLRR